MKKLVLGVLTVFTLFGLAGCQGGGKKLSAEEAKTEIKAIAESTLKEGKKLGSFKANQTFSASIEAKDIKAKAGSLTMNFGSGKASAKLNTSVGASINSADKKAKIGGKIDASVNASVKSKYLKEALGWDSETQKYNYTAKASADAYYAYAGKEQITETYSADTANIYTSYSGEINKELADILKTTQTKVTGANNFKTYDFGGLFNIYDEGSSNEVDLDFIQDWTIFTKKGNTITADCSNLDAFELGYDLTSTQTMLKEYGLDFKVSKFQFSFNNDNVITKFDFAMSLKGKVDLSKIDLSNLMGESEVSYAGTITANMTFGFGFELGYKEETITIPENLTKLEEEDFDEALENFEDYIEDSGIFNMIEGLINGNGSGKTNSSVKKAENLISCMKMIALEGSAQASENVTVTVDYGSTATSFPTLKVYDGTTDKTSTWAFSSMDVYVEGLSATGSFSLTYNPSTAKFSYSTSTLKIDGDYITVNADGSCELAK